MTILTPTAALETLIFDPISEDAANFELDLNSGDFDLLSAEFPSPPRDAQYAEPADSPGDLPVFRRDRNRDINFKVAIVSASDATLRTACATLAGKIAKLNDRGGTLKRIFPDATEIVFDIFEADVSWPVDIAYSVGHVVEVSMSLKCDSYGRGVEVAYALHTESTLPVLVFTEDLAPGGDVPALGRLVVTDAQGADQQWLMAGLQVANFDPADPATEKLFYEAESRTRLGVAALVTDTTASPPAGANNAVRADLTTSYTNVLSTRATGVGAHLTHVGGYRVFARVKADGSTSGVVSIALEWAIADRHAFTRNPLITVVPAVSGSTWNDADLGVVQLAYPPVGDRQWEGRIIARSTAANGLTIDCLWLVPVDEFSGELSAVQREVTITTYSARDNFVQAAGNATGKTLPAGGTWTGAGDADDFTIDGLGDLKRIATADPSTSLASGRLLTASTPTSLTDTVTMLRCSFGLGAAMRNDLLSGVMARYVNTANFLVAHLTLNGGGNPTLTVATRIASVDTVLDSASWVGSTTEELRIFLNVGATGQVVAYVLGADGSQRTQLTLFNSALIAAGALDDGTVGIMDRNTGATATARYYTDFYAYAPEGVDAAVFATRSAQFRYDGVIRQDTSGAVYAPASRYEGDLLTVPVAGPEGRGLRCIVKGSRSLPDVGDPAIDDISARLYVTPRFLVVPS